MIIHSIVGLIKRPSKYIKMSQYFPKPYEPFGGDISKSIYLIMQQRLI